MRRVPRCEFLRQRLAQRYRGVTRATFVRFGLKEPGCQRLVLGLFLLSVGLLQLRG